MKITQDEVEFLVYCIKMSLDALLLRLTNGKGDSIESDCLVGLGAEEIETVKRHLKMTRASLDKLLPHCQDKELVDHASTAINWFESNVSFCGDEPESTETLVARYLMGLLVDEALKDA